MDERLKVALISSLIIFLFGGLPSVLLNCWSWFGRSGALLVIYGVALAWYNFNHEHEFGKAVNDAHKTIDDHIDDDDVGRHKKFINEYETFSFSNTRS